MHISEDDLRTILQPFGDIESVHLHRDDLGTSKGYAFVKFLRAEDATVAMQNIGSEGLELMGKAIKVGYVTDNMNAGGSASASGNWRLDDDDGTGLQMNAQSRAALMARLGQSAGIALPGAKDSAAQAHAFARASASAGMLSSIKTQPTNAILIQNMFDPSSETEPHWDQDIKEDTEQECGNFGTVLHCHVDRTNPAGLVHLLFGNIDAATKALNHLNGRWFAGRTITVDYVPLVEYGKRFPQLSSTISNL